MAASEALPNAEQLSRIRARTLWVLSSGQVLGGLAFGATIALGALLAAEVSGDDALSGLATAFVTLGAAASAVPLSRMARRRGRRLSLASGMLIALAGVAVLIVATSLQTFLLLLAGFALIGAGQAANLQSRFAAADLATDSSRGRDLSLVVWATTIGAVAGPNLIGPGDAVGAVLGMPALTGAYVFTVIAQVLAIVLYLSLLRPDPLLLAQRIVADTARSAAAIVQRDQPRRARFAMTAVAAAHLVMVAVMAMTPVHLAHHGAAIEVIGLTISLHIAGMYALAPVFGYLADRVGRLSTILVGQALLAASLIVGAVGAESTSAVTVALVLLGLGWSAVTVAGATLLTEASSESRRTQRQGRNDLLMNLVGAAGAIGAGVVRSAIGYDGLAFVSLVAVAAVVILAPLGRAAARG